MCRYYLKGCYNSVYHINTYDHTIDLKDKYTLSNPFKLSITEVYYISINCKFIAIIHDSFICQSNYESKLQGKVPVIYK
jgi:hypothetical protein